VITALLQARTSSRRLPGKVLADLHGRPMLERQIERVSRSTHIERLIVATSDDASDDAIAALCRELGVGCFRGSLDDVLARFYAAACSLSPRPEHIVRLTGDCPLADAALIDRLIAFHLEASADYSSNALERRFPQGLDAEVIRFSALEAAQREATLPSEREHVTPFLYRRPERFRIASMRGERELGALRWTVDELADLRFVRRVFAALYPSDPAFSWLDVLALVERDPTLAQENAAVDPSEGWRRSLEADKRQLEKSHA
jgi:spore coat polysaccharide biosynthesis protein SpsF